MSEINPRKLKVQELRTELRSRGLSEEGKKQELVERLENFLDAEALGDDLDTNPRADQQTDTPTEQVASEAQPVPTQEVVAAPVTVPEPSSATTEVPTSDEPTTKKVVKITEIKSITEMTEAERLAARAARFGLPAQTDEEAKKAARAQRFDIPQKVVVAGKELTVKELDARKKRMERFGVVTEQNEKLLVRESIVSVWTPLHGVNRRKKRSESERSVLA